MKASKLNGLNLDEISLKETMRIKNGGFLADAVHRGIALPFLDLSGYG